MKHRVTVEVKTKKHFLGIPYTVMEKKKVTVDGKIYRAMKREEQEKPWPHQEAAVAAMLMMEEEEELCDR